MVYSNLNKPSKNMMLPYTEIIRMTVEQQQRITESEQSKVLVEQSAIERERSEYSSFMNEYVASCAHSTKKMDYLNNVKQTLLSECMMKLYAESYPGKMTQKTTTVAKNLINNFINENGVGNLLFSFRNSGSYLLTEMSRLCYKYYDLVVENYNTFDDESEAPSEWGLNKTIKDDFYEELIGLDTIDAGRLIKDRVADSIQEFIDSNTSAKLDYEDIIQTAQDKITTSTDDAVAESFNTIAQRQINEKRLHRKKNVFHVMVESLTTKALTDDSFKTMYVNEASVNMDKVVADTATIYTMLEMLNTTRMVNIDENFIDNYLQSLK